MQDQTKLKHEAYVKELKAKIQTLETQDIKMSIKNKISQATPLAQLSTATSQK